MVVVAVQGEKILSVPGRIRTAIIRLDSGWLDQGDQLWPE